MALLTRDAFINGHDLHRNYKQRAAHCYKDGNIDTEQ